VVVTGTTTTEALMTTITHTTLYTVSVVADRFVETEFHCDECSDVDATVEINVYVRNWGETVRFAGCCVPCGQRIATEDGAAEILIEVPASLAALTLSQLIT
jgi:hypothetical protein